MFSTGSRVQAAGSQGVVGSAWLESMQRREVSEGFGRPM